ncbi:hypothetical protein K7711_46495 [Nocardia sp. CA2R105]|uniref:colicin immunity domain-containing protein n=1 Tax=Nocardia coffeae TaxID=2873381 RepID=UPI001CA634CE|nr:colicin immunity domain-containing protein [Nocardia coffeae]MBY8863982.1 hypothetical protein [Nocardia coffeae]
MPQINSDTNQALSAYLELIGQFVDGNLSAENFESAFLSRFKNETTHFTDDAFNILDGLFGDVDDYVSDPELRAEAGGLDDEQLRTCARNAYTALRSM